MSDVQRIAPASVDPRTKNYHWLDMVGALFQAHEHGAETAVLVDGAGNITEGPGFNVFALVDGELITPAAGVLEGIRAAPSSSWRAPRYWRCAKRCRWPRCGAPKRCSSAAPAAA